MENKISKAVALTSLIEFSFNRPMGLCQVLVLDSPGQDSTGLVPARTGCRSGGGSGGPGTDKSPAAMYNKRNMAEFEVIHPGEDDLNRRLDRVARKVFNGMTLGEIYKALRLRRITVNGKAAGASYRLEPGDTLEYHPELKRFAERGLPSGSPAPPGEKSPGDKRSGQEPRNPLPEDWLLLETEDLLLLNKPPGLLVHGPGSLESLVRDYLRGRIGDSLSFRPGPLHRLDRNTSGIIAFGKSLRGAREFSRLMAGGQIRKTYLGILSGELKDEQLWEDHLLRAEKVTRVIGAAGGKTKTASTLCRPVLAAGGHTLCVFSIYTGRTHQIRAQAAGRGFPLAGDRKYAGPGGSKSPGPRGYQLHAWRLRLPASELFPRGLDLPAEPPEGFFRAAEGLFPGKPLRKIIKEYSSSQ